MSFPKNLHDIRNDLECPWYLELDERTNAFYAGLYLTGKGYDVPPPYVNQTILNMKKKPSTCQLDRRQAEYKLAAINEIGNCLGDALISAQILKDDCAAIAIPSSLPKTDRDYDDRCEQMIRLACSKLASFGPRVRIYEWASAGTSSMTYHSTNDRPLKRTPEQVFSNFNFDAAVTEKLIAHHQIALFDDMITSGGHFMAFLQKLRQAGYQGDVVGIFASRAISDESFGLSTVVEQSVRL